jgi:hypothetical protein
MFDSSTVSSINERRYFNIAVGKLEMRLHKGYSFNEMGVRLSHEATMNRTIFTLEQRTGKSLSLLIACTNEVLMLALYFEGYPATITKACRMSAFMYEIHTCLSCCTL